MLSRHTIVHPEALELFQHFAAQKDLKVAHIATPITIDVLLGILARDKPERILELGGGAGTLTYALVKHSDAFIDVYENLDFCRENIRRNLAFSSKRYSIIDNYETPPPAKGYDLVIIDGPGAYTSGEKIKIVRQILAHLDAVTIVYLEGSRYDQRFAAIDVLGRRYRLLLTRHKSGIVNGQWYKGGLEIRCISDANASRRTFHRIFWSVKEHAHSYIRWLRGRPKKYANYSNDSSPQILLVRSGVRPYSENVY